MSRSYKNFGYNHDPLEDSHSFVGNTTRTEEAPSSSMDEFYKERDKMMAALNSFFNSYDTPCRDPPSPPPQHHSHFNDPYPPYSPSYHEPYFPPYPSSYQALKHEPSSPPYTSCHEPSSPFQPYPPPFQHSYQTPYQPPPPSEPITPKPTGLDAFFDYPNMDDHTKELKRMYKVHKARSMELYRKKNTIGLSKKLKEELQELGEYLNAFYLHVLWKRTGGEEGTLWPYDINDEEEPGTSNEEQHPTSLVEEPQSLVVTFNEPTQVEEMKQATAQPKEEMHSPLGNTPILEEINPSLVDSLVEQATNHVSDDEVDEEIICEFPHRFIDEYAQLSASSSSSSIEHVACTIIDSSCDNHASLLSTSHDDVVELNVIKSCSCVECQICVHCYDVKKHLLVEFKKHALDTLTNSTIEYDASNSARSAEISKHEILENENCIVVKNEDDFCPIRLHDIESAPMEDSPCIDVALVDNRGSFKQILSCDLPPDISKNESVCCATPIIPFSFPPFSTTSCVCVSDIMFSNHVLEFTIPATYTLECFQNSNSCFTPTDGSLIDFLGCHTYLDKSFPCLELDTALFVAMFLQETQHFTPRKEYVGEGSYMKKSMFLIRDENFSYKSLKRFKRKVVPFLSCLFIAFNFCILF